MAIDAGEAAIRMVIASVLAEQGEIVTVITSKGKALAVSSASFFL
jgi:hypothetical protein